MTLHSMRGIDLCRWEAHKSRSAHLEKTLLIAVKLTVPLFTSDLSVAIAKVKKTRLIANQRAAQVLWAGVLENKSDAGW